MIDRLEATLKRYNEIGEELANPEIISDIKKMTLLSKERTGLEKTVEVYKEYKKVLDDIEEAKELLKDKDMAEFAKEELSSAEEKKDKLESELEVLLIPHDPNDDKNVIVEIRGAAGGDEANIFAGNLFDMYSRYASREGLKEKLNGEPITFYWGTDPTADSLHIGHYSALCTAKRLANAGHHPILLCGGATGRIGDPRPTSEREIISNEAVNKNIISIKKQIDRLFNGKAEIVDNYDWTKDYTYLEFLRDIGKYINVNYMINKDIIARRLESGITYAEFSYTLLQGYDFIHYIFYFFFC
jgi:hypothetical protein